MAGNINGYLRVTTAKQGRSGLGLEAKREAIARFALSAGYEIAGENVEVETGKGADALDRRPQLAAAWAEAKKRKCAVVVAMRGEGLRGWPLTFRLHEGSRRIGHGRRTALCANRRARRNRAG